MNQPLPSYPDYKPASLLWLAQVPAHWAITRAKNLFQKMDRPVRESDDVVTCFRDGVVTLRKNRRVRGFTEAMKEHGYQGIRVGDLVIHGMDAFAGAIGVSDSDGKGTPVYIVCQPKQELVPAYFAYVIREMSRNQFILSLAKGIRERSTDFRYETLAALNMPVPPLQEQQRIVAFLDAKGRQIVRLLRHKRQLIKLLNEQKQALIHRAVTQGLDADAPRRNSGVAWLGEVPAHWKVLRIKYILREVDSRSATGSEVLLSMRMHHGLVPYHEHFDRPQQSSSLIDYKLVKPGQLVINRMQAGNGVIFFSQLHGLVSPDYAVFDVINDANTTFLGEVFRNHATRKKFRSESKGLGTGTSGFLRLYTDRLGAIHLALPPRSEQDFIIEERDARLAKTNETISRAQREIELIQEYRTRLIADVVTGRVDVRHLAVAALPEAEVDLLDEEADEEESEEELLLETEDGRE